MKVRFKPGSGHVGFVVDKVALEQVFFEYFGFPCQSSFHELFHNHHHLAPGAGTVRHKWPQYKGLSPTPLAIKRRPSSGILSCQNIAVVSDGHVKRVEVRSWKLRI